MANENVRVWEMLIERGEKLSYHARVNRCFADYIGIQAKVTQNLKVM